MADREGVPSGAGQERPGADVGAAAGAAIVSINPLPLPLGLLTSTDLRALLGIGPINPAAGCSCNTQDCGCDGIYCRCDSVKGAVGGEMSLGDFVKLRADTIRRLREQLEAQQIRDEDVESLRREP